MTSICLENDLILLLQSEICEIGHTTDVDIISLLYVAVSIRKHRGIRSCTVHKRYSIYWRLDGIGIEHLRRFRVVGCFTLEMIWHKAETNVFSLVKLIHGRVLIPDLHLWDFIAESQICHSIGSGRGIEEASLVVSCKRNDVG